MSQLRPYEGSNAEELVEQVRRELGPDAKIVRGETHRTGGVLGFFSKEQLRLYAEVPERDADAVPRQARLPRPLTKLATSDVFATMADETADRNDVTSTPPGWPGPVPATAAARRGTVAFLPAARAEGAAPVSSPIGAGPEEPATPVDFGAVLRDVARAVEDEPAAVAAPRGSHFRQNGQAASNGAVAASAPEAAPRPPVSVPVPVTNPEASPPGSTWAKDLRLSDPAPIQQPARDRDLAIALRASGLRREDAAAVAERVAEGVDLSVVLTQLFVRLAPAPTPLRPGPAHRLVLVGSAEETRRLAVDIALECDVAPDEIAFADAAPGGDQARAVILALDAPLTALGLARQRRAVATLGPATVIGVVSALIKAEDILAWADGLGGIDALAMVGMSGTHSPAAVLRTGIPVARLDGRPASPARWAATVVDLIEVRP